MSINSKAFKIQPFWTIGLEDNFLDYSFIIAVEGNLPRGLLHPELITENNCKNSSAIPGVLLWNILESYHSTVKSKQNLHGSPI